MKEHVMIATARDSSSFRHLLGDGSELGISISYAIQEQPNGLAEAFIIGEKFIGEDNVALVLGDNIFHGQGFTDKLIQARNKIESGESGSVIFGYHVKKPGRFGVIEFNKNMDVVSIEEKPKIPKSNYAATGLYFYDNQVIKIAKNIKPSNRGELEITDVNKEYLIRRELSVELLGRGFAWLDTGTHDSLLDASQYIKTIQERQNTQVANPVEIAYRKGWITTDDVLDVAQANSKNGYGEYLFRIASDK